MLTAKGAYWLAVAEINDGKRGNRDMTLGLADLMKLENCLRAFEIVCETRSAKDIFGAELLESYSSDAKELCDKFEAVLMDSVVKARPDAI